jgi:hypothetical protein
VALAQHYIDAGDLASARFVLAVGLTHDPVSQPLVDRQKAIGKTP